MRARVVVALLVTALAFYLVLVGYQGLRLVLQGGVVPVLFGLSIIVLPLLGAYVVAREVQFGFAAARLGRDLEAAGRWPTEQLPTSPSGRPLREAADTLFAVRRDEVDASPQDWGSWYRLGLAYDDAGDRKRAREAIRTAIALHRAP